MLRSGVVTWIVPASFCLTTVSRQNFCLFSRFSTPKTISRHLPSSKISTPLFLVRYGIELCHLNIIGILLTVTINMQLEEYVIKVPTDTIQVAILGDVRHGTCASVMGMDNSAWFH
ncbi:hypothetical protein B0T25DRAFT_551366 [Lasiosphaeria hispida]|uniref:Uncharacterized protein n=1 Tax=Lasiosphaeria hispida TaxID=260671 RepID=A0AAJ0MAE7_9PEZI|nr:hypothetical protein B0T25DRAFT_551366 [Lasiosphaeria hispida]